MTSTDAAGSAIVVAFAVTVEPAAAAPGAVYFPLTSMMPTAALPPTILLTDQVTAVLARPFAYAVRRRSPPIGTLTELGKTVTLAATAGAAIATVRSRASRNGRWPYARIFGLPIAALLSERVA